MYLAQSIRRAEQLLTVMYEAHDLCHTHTNTQKHTDVINNETNWSVPSEIGNRVTQQLVKSTQREVSGDGQRSGREEEKEGGQRRRREEEEEEEGRRGGKKRREEEEEEGRRREGSETWKRREGEGSEQSNMEVRAHLSIENDNFETSSLLSCVLLACSPFSSHK